MSEAVSLTHAQAVNQLKDIDDELERLQAKESLTPEDELRFAELTQKFDEIDEYRKQLERKSERARIQAVRQNLSSARPLIERTMPDRGEGYDRDVVRDPDAAEDLRFRNPWDLSDVRSFGRSPSEVGAEMRARALSAIEKMPGCADRHREVATKMLTETVDKPDKLARQILLTSSPAYLRAWSKLARNKQHTMTAEENRALDEVESFRAMSLTDNAGGYLVPFQLDPAVIITSDGSRNDIRKVARVVQATGDVWNGVSSGAVSWSWDSEGAEVSDDATTFAGPAITIYTARGFVPISIEALEDEQNVTAEVAKLLAFGKDTLEATAFATGTGSAPQGIVTALTGGSSEINAAADDTFAIGDVYTIQGSLPARYRANASWLANNLIYNKIRQFDTAGGAGMWERIGGDRPPELLGRPALESEAMDGTVTTSGATSNFILVFGDFSNYVIADRVGMTVELIPHLFHTSNNRPSGQRGWFAHVRCGADSVNDGAFRMLDVASAA